MRPIMVAAASLAAAAVLWAANAQQAVNANCPVKGTPVKAGNSSTYKGKVIGFC